MKNCFREKGVEVHHTSTPNEGENQSPQEKKENTQTHTNSQTKQNHETNFQSSKALEHDCLCTRTSQKPALIVSKIEGSSTYL